MPIYTQQIILAFLFWRASGRYWGVFSVNRGFFLFLISSYCVNYTKLWNSVIKYEFFFLLFSTQSSKNGVVLNVLLTSEAN